LCQNTANHRTDGRYFTCGGHRDVPIGRNEVSRSGVLRCHSLTTVQRTHWSRCAGIALMTRLFISAAEKSAVAIDSSSGA
jgi:hypothetical protein